MDQNTALVPAEDRSVAKVKPHATYWKYQIHNWDQAIRLNASAYERAYQRYADDPKYTEITYAEYRAFHQERAERHLHGVQAYVNYETLRSIKRHAEEKGMKPATYASSILESYMRTLERMEAEKQA